MDKYLSQYITSLNYGSESKASSVLEEVKISKDNLAILSAKLSDAGLFSNIQLGEIKQNSKGSSISLSQKITDAQNRLETAYNQSNEVSLLFQGVLNILLTETKALDAEVSALEKAVNNYSFLLSDNKSYDFLILRLLTIQKIKQV